MLWTRATAVLYSPAFKHIKQMAQLIMSVSDVLHFFLSHHFLVPRPIPRPKSDYRKLKPLFHPVGNGQVWVQAELPALMRNENTHQIVSVYRTVGGKWEQFIEWDANAVKNQSFYTISTSRMLIVPSKPGAKPRDFVPQAQLDSATSIPIVPGSVRP